MKRRAEIKVTFLAKLEEHFNSCVVSTVYVPLENGNPSPMRVRYRSDACISRHGQAGFFTPAMKTLYSSFTLTDPSLPRPSSIEGQGIRAFEGMFAFHAVWKVEFLFISIRFASCATSTS